MTRSDRPGADRRRLLVGLLALVVLAPAVLSGRGEPPADAATVHRVQAAGVAARPAAATAPAAGSPDQPGSRPSPPPAGGAPAAPLPAVFAGVDGLELRLPAADTLLVGYHEASFPDALAVTPRGRLRSNDNPTKAEPPGDDPAGPAYAILSSRGRPHPATSAVDLVLTDDTPVLSPVTGSVVEVRRYELYGRHRDHRIEIAPDSHPHLRVVVIHVSDVRVARGDHVQAGVSALAGRPTRFPFASQIDRFLEPDRWPHVHLEVKRAG